MAQLRSHVDEVHSNGAEMVIIGNGKPHFAKSFQEELKLTTPLYTDPEMATYRAAGFKRGLMSLIGPGAFMRTMHNIIHGSGKITGDPLQQGGVFIVMPDGKVVYNYVSKVVGDHPDPKDILSALSSATKHS